MRAGFLLPALLLAVPVAREAQIPTTGETVIRGVVFDSLRMRPLGNANVQIAAAAGTPWIRTYETDSNGTFEFTGVPNGTYLIGFFHAELDSLGLLPPTFRLDVRSGPPIHMRLAIPSARTIARSLCGRNGTSDSTGLLLSYVRGADNSMPRPDGKLVIRWAEIVIKKKSISRDVPTIEASSGPNGLAAVCGVPVATSILVQGASAGDSSGAFEITLPSSGFYHRDIFVAPLARASVSTSDSVPPVALLRGAGRVRGHVTGATGRPIPGARVTVWGTGIETVTDAAGEFTLGNLPGGTHAGGSRPRIRAGASTSRHRWRHHGRSGGRAHESRDHARHDQSDSTARLHAPSDRFRTSTAHGHGAFHRREGDRAAETDLPDRSASHATGCVRRADHMGRVRRAHARWSGGGLGHVSSGSRPRRQSAVERPCLSDQLARMGQRGSGGRGVQPIATCPRAVPIRERLRRHRRLDWTAKIVAVGLRLSRMVGKDRRGEWHAGDDL